MSAEPLGAELLNIARAPRRGALRLSTLSVDQTNAIVDRAVEQRRYFTGPSVGASAMYTDYVWNDKLTEATNRARQRGADVNTLYTYLRGRWNAQAATELIEAPTNINMGPGQPDVVIGGAERRLLLTMEHVPGETFPMYFTRHVQNQMFQQSVEEATWGAVIAFPLPDRDDRRPVNLRNWRDGNFNCLVKPILDRLVSKLESVTASYEAKPTSEKKSMLARYQTKVAIAERTLAGVASVGIGCDLVRVLCQQVQICVEVKSMIAAHHPVKCTVCLAHVLDTSTHVCGSDGSSRTIDFVTVFKCDKTRNRNDFSFVFIETRDGHVVLGGNAGFRQTCFMTSCGETTELADLAPLYASLIEADTLFAFKQDASGRVTKIMQPGEPPVSAPAHPFWVIHRSFMKETQLVNCFVDAVQQPELSSFVVASMLHNATVDAPGFNNVRDAGEPWIGSIDMRRAYANVAACEYYTGYLGKIHEFRLMSAVVPGRNGLYWVDVNLVPAHLVNPMTAGWFVSGVYTSPELAYWVVMGVRFTVRAGCIGSDIQFDFNDHPEMMERYAMDGGADADGIRGYCLSTGVMQSHSLTETYNLFLGSKCGNLFKDMPGVYVNDSTRTATATFPKWTCQHLCHVVAFIFAYVRIGVMQQVLDMGASVLRVCVDGIYFDKRLYTPPVGLASFDRVWGVDDEVRMGNDSGPTYVCRDLGFTAAHLATLSPRVTDGFSEMLITGMGGNGKSHVVCTDILLPGNPVGKRRDVGDGGANGGLVRPVLLVPTHAQRREKMEDYPGLIVWTHARLFNFMGGVDKSVHPNVSELGCISNVLMFDECSMIPDVLRALVVATFPMHKIIWLGDVGYQCPPFPITGPIGEKIERPEFNPLAVAHRMELTVNYRIKCPQLMNLAQQLRRGIEANDRPAMGSSVVRACVQRISLAAMPSVYCKGDLVICRTHEQIATASDALCHVFGQYKTGRNKMVFKLEPRCVDVVAYTVNSIPKASAMHCHGFTVHATQGQTVKRPRRVFLCLSRDMELRVLYTAVTRCEYIDQLYYYVDGSSAGAFDGEADGGDSDADDQSEELEEALAVVDHAVRVGIREAWRMSSRRQLK